MKQHLETDWQPLPSAARKTVHQVREIEMQAVEGELGAGEEEMGEVEGEVEEEAGEDPPEAIARQEAAPELVVRGKVVGEEK